MKRFAPDPAALDRMETYQVRSKLPGRHGFDSATLSALAEGVLGSSPNGFATRPYLREEVVRIPQQLWGPAKKSAGLWTICIHTNTASPTFEALHHIQ